MGASRRARRSVERRRIAAARRTYRRRARLEAIDAAVLPDLDSFTIEDLEPVRAPLPEAVEVEDPAVHDPVAAAFRRIVGSPSDAQPS